MEDVIKNNYAMPSPLFNWEQNFRPDGKVCMGYGLNPDCKRITHDLFCDNCRILKTRKVQNDVEKYIERDVEKRYALIECYRRGILTEEEINNQGVYLNE